MRDDRIQYTRHPNLRQHVISRFKNRTNHALPNPDISLATDTTAFTSCLDAQKRLHGGSSKRRARSRFDARAPVAQLDRAPDYESGGQEFESLRARQLNQRLRQHSDRPCFPETRLGSIWETSGAFRCREGSEAPR